MLTPLGAARWALRPLDNLVNATAAITGGILGLPLLCLAILRDGPRVALSPVSFWRIYGEGGVPLGKHTFAGEAGEGRISLLWT